MRTFVDRLGYPGTAWRRPLLWTLGVALVIVAQAVPQHAMNETFADRVFGDIGLLAIARYAGRSWRKHRVSPLPPLGRVAWPSSRHS